MTNEKVDLDFECGYISDALRKFDYYLEDKDADSIDIEKLTEIYKTINEGLTSSEYLIMEGPKGFIENAKRARRLLENRLVQTSVRIIMKDLKFRDSKTLEKSPWIKKFKDKSYFNQLFENDSTTKDRMYDILFNKDIYKIVQEE